MSKDVRQENGLIGPNAILQLLPVLDEFGGQKRRTELLAHARVFHIPDGASMIAETEAANLHRQLRREESVAAPTLARKAGQRTADYILSNRIPRFAQLILKVLPAPLSAKLLANAIRKNAWTFVGSGTFKVISPRIFEITDNPLIAGERSDACLCDWHVGVFERLYQKLAAPDFRCVETRCGAQGSGSICRFELHRSR